MHHRRPCLAVLAAVLAILVVPAVARAQGDSGFLRGKGNLDLAITYGLDTYDEFWLGSSKVSSPPFGRVTRQYASVYGAYGLTDDVDLTFNGSYVYVDTDAVFDDEDALQDLALQAKARLGSFRLGDGTLSVLADPGLKVPLTHYEDNAVNAVGDGQVDLRLRGIVQYLLDGGAYLAVETGYDVRFDAPPDEVPVHFTAGFNIADGVTVSGFVSWINSLGGYDIGQGPFPGVEEEYVRVGGGLYWRVNEQFGITANGWTTVDGKNTGDVDGFSIGVVLRY